MCARIAHSVWAVGSDSCALSAAEADAAIEGLNGKDLGGRIIKVTNSRRNGAYHKTPGQYLGPRSVSSKYGGPSRCDMLVCLGGKEVR